jgi:hypothetical protein
MRVLPMAYIEHQIPGCMRLRVPERRGDVGFFQSIVGTLSKLPEITELDGSPLSGSIRIRHTGMPDAILAAAAEQGLFEIGKQESDAEPKKPRKQLQGDAGMLDTIATGLSGLAPILGFGLRLEPADVLCWPLGCLASTCHSSPSLTGSTLIVVDARGIGLSPPLAFVGGVVRGIMSARKTSADSCGFRGAYRLAIVTKNMHRQVTRESRTHANSPGRIARCRRISRS